MSNCLIWSLPGRVSLLARAKPLSLLRVGNLFAQRTERISVFRIRFFSNWLVSVGIATELLLCTLIYAPFLRSVFGLAPFPWRNWLFLLAWTPALLVDDELRKAWLRQWEWSKVHF